MIYKAVDYGAVGDGVTDDRPAIQDAIDEATAIGGPALIQIPDNSLLDSLTAAPFCLNVIGDNIVVEAESARLAKLTLGDGVDGHMLNFDGTDGSGFRNLEINGNRTNQTIGVHGVRGVGVSNFVAEDFFIHHTFHYGLGLQAGTIKGSRIRHGRIEDTGGDGFDCKNPNDDNEDNTMYDVTVRRSGLNGALTSPQACLDFRGPWSVSKVRCLDFANTGGSVCGAGIRFRHGEATDSTGLGAHHSDLASFYVKPSNKTGVVGVELSAYQVAVGVGHVLNAELGYLINQHEPSIGQAFAIACTDGFLFNASGLATDGNRATVDGAVARSCSGTGFIVETDYVQLNNIVSRSNSKGVDIKNTADHTTLSGVVQSNSVANLINNGMNTHNNLSVY
jgi:hypothetical protein